MLQSIDSLLMIQLKKRSIIDKYSNNIWQIKYCRIQVKGSYLKRIQCMNYLKCLNKLLINLKQIDSLKYIKIKIKNLLKN